MVTMCYKCTSNIQSKTFFFFLDAHLNTFRNISEHYIQKIKSLITIPVKFAHKIKPEVMPAFHIWIIVLLHYFLRDAFKFTWCTKFKTKTSQCAIKSVWKTTRCRIVKAFMHNSDLVCNCMNIQSAGSSKMYTNASTPVSTLDCILT